MQEAIDGQRDEYVFGAEDGRLVFTGEQLRYLDGETGTEADAIAVADVTDVRTAVDESVTGFRVIGIAIGLVALLFTGATANLIASGAGVDLISVGSALCGAFGWLAAIQYYRAERGALTVVVIDTSDDEYVFYTQASDDDVDSFVAALAENARDAGKPQPASVA